MRKKRIYLNPEKTKYCIVHLFKYRKEMQDFYFKEDRAKREDKHYNTLGVHLAYTVYTPVKGKKNKWKPGPITGSVLLNLQNCGAGIVTHELMHAVLWAYRHEEKEHDNQYPIIIHDMEEEEEILHRHTLAVMAFYRWYWKIKDKVRSVQK